MNKTSFYLGDDDKRTDNFIGEPMKNFLLLLKTKFDWAIEILKLIRNAWYDAITRVLQVLKVI